MCLQQLPTLGVCADREEYSTQPYVLLRVRKEGRFQRHQQAVDAIDLGALLQDALRIFPNCKQLH